MLQVIDVAFGRGGKFTVFAFLFEVLPPVDGGVLTADLAGWRLQCSRQLGLTVRNATTSASDSETAETGDAFDRVHLGSFDEVELLVRAVVSALLVSCKTVSSQERRVVFFSFLILTLRGFEGMLRECLLACRCRVICEKSRMARGSESYRPVFVISNLAHSLVPLRHHAVIVNLKLWRIRSIGNTASRLERFKQNEHGRCDVTAFTSQFETTLCRRRSESNLK